MSSELTVSNGNGKVTRGRRGGSKGQIVTPQPLPASAAIDTTAVLIAEMGEAAVFAMMQMLLTRKDEIVAAETQAYDGERAFLVAKEAAEKKGRDRARHEVQSEQQAALAAAKERKAQEFIDTKLPELIDTLVATFSSYEAIKQYANAAARTMGVTIEWGEIAVDDSFSYEAKIQ